MEATYFGTETLRNEFYNFSQGNRAMTASLTTSGRLPLEVIAIKNYTVGFALKS